MTISTLAQPVTFAGFVPVLQIIINRLTNLTWLECTFEIVALGGWGWGVRWEESCCAKGLNSPSCHKEMKRMSTEAILMYIRFVEKKYIVEIVIKYSNSHETG